MELDALPDVSVGGSLAFSPTSTPVVAAYCEEWQTETQKTRKDIRQPSSRFHSCEHLDVLLLTAIHAEICQGIS